MISFLTHKYIFSNLDEIITHDKVTTNQNTGEREEQVLHLVEYGVSSEDDIMIVIKEERDNYYCGAIGESQNPFLSAMKQASIIRDRMTQQLKKQKLTVGLHQGKLNPLPITWEFPKGFTVINLMNMWLMENRKENIPPLQYLTKPRVEQIKNGHKNSSKMIQVMKQAKDFGLDFFGGTGFMEWRKNDKAVVNNLA